MTDMTLPEIIEKFERTFPGWEWLLRSNKRKEDVTGDKYFVNLLSPNFVAKLKINAVTGKSNSEHVGAKFPAYGQTPEEAFHKATSALVLRMNDEAREKIGG